MESVKSIAGPTIKVESNWSHFGLCEKQQVPPGLFKSSLNQLQWDRFDVVGYLDQTYLDHI